MSRCTEGSADLHNGCRCACMINNSWGGLHEDFLTHYDWSSGSVLQLSNPSALVIVNHSSISDIPPPLSRYLLRDSHLFLFCFLSR